MPDKETNILDYLYTVLKWKKFIFFFTFTVGTMTAVITLILPKWYSSTSTVLVTETQQGISISSLLPGGSIPFAGDLFNLNEESQQYMAILESRIAQEYIARKFNLQEQYKQDNLEDTIEELRGHFEFGLTDEGAIYLTVEDRSPIHASEMANSYVQFLDSLNIDLQTKQARNNRVFIQRRYDQNVIEMFKAENNLELFQKENNILSLPAQLEAALNAYSDLKALSITKTIELETLENTFAPGHPGIVQLRSEIRSMDNHIRQFEGNSEYQGFNDDNTKYLVPFADIPELEMDFFRLKREVEIQNTLFTLLTQQLEQAKIQEAKDTPTLMTLDIAIPAIKRSRPKRTVIVLAVSGLAFLFVIFLVFTLEYINRLQKTSPHEQEKMHAIRGLLSKKSNMNE